MNNKSNMFLSALFICAVAMGCSSLNPLSSGSSESSSGSSGGKKESSALLAGLDEIGIEECDAIVKELAAQIDSEDDGYITRSVKQYYINTVIEGLKKSVEENKNEPDKLKNECIKFKKQLDLNRDK